MARRLQAKLGIDPIAAIFSEALAPEMGLYEKARDFAASLILVPEQPSTGGKTIPGQTSKVVKRVIRPVLIAGAMRCVAAATYSDKRCNLWLQKN